uniref:Penicillin-binding protein n=1 Tax=uncultured bacterium lac160 TaxID=1447241 RepID=X2LCD3_9BACT|nr:penicillin-binding protein [uncultured bacterium lac160]
MRECPAAFGRLAVGLILMAACSRAEPAVPAGGSLEVRWVGSDTGKLAAPAVAEWCDSLRMLEVSAVHGDTGIALVLYPADSVTPGRYPLVPPQRRDSTRPSAALAIRWFAETSIRGFRSDSGAVRVAALGPGTGSGTFGARLRSATEGSLLRVTGSFQGLTVRRATAECAGVAQSPDDTMPDLEEEFEESPD